MNFTRILTLTAIAALTVGAWHAFGWPGIALAVGGIFAATVYLVWDDLAPFADDLVVQSIAWRGDTDAVAAVA
jgi:hypothetical protein